MVPWLADHPGVALGELAGRFGVDESELERDLELLPLCGLPPYSPDRLIEVDLSEDGHVWIRFAEYFDRPLRLTAEEGLTLLAAGRALLSVPGSDADGTLASALEKLADALGTREGLSVEVGESAHLDELRSATARRERIEIDYYSFGRDALTTRRVDPRAVFHAYGHWYVDAWCHLVQAERLFRADRVQAVRPTGETFEASEVDADVGDRVYEPRPDDPRVTIELGPDAGWVVESYPTELVEERDDGTRRVVLAISEQVWLERLMLRLGPEGRIVDPPELGGATAAAAARVLARYR